MIDNYFRTFPTVNIIEVNDHGFFCPHVQKLKKKTSKQQQNTGEMRARWHLR